MHTAGDVIGGRFDLVGVVSKGAMGEVHRALDLSTGAPAAVKLSISTPRGRIRALREARLLSRLHHAAFVKYLAHGETDDSRVWLAMEWLEGETLAERLRRGRIELGEAVRIVADAAAGLAEAHDRGIVHRDVTPNNVFLVAREGARRTEVRLIDVGVAVETDSIDPGAAGAVVGTPHYMAPEQALGSAQVGPEADVYSLGAVLFELVTGRPPFDAQNLMALLGRIALERPPRIRDFRREVPVAIDLLVARCLAKEPRDRPSAAELSADLASIPTGAHRAPAISTPRPISPTVGSPAYGERRVTVVLAAALADGVPLPIPLAHALSSLIGPAGATRLLADGSFVAAFGASRTRGDEVAVASRIALSAIRAHPALRCAIGTGLAHEEEGGPTGDALDRAAALLEGAGRGEVVLDSASAALLDDRFEVVYGDDRNILVRETEGSVAPPTLLGRMTTFVGRERELDVALTVFRDAAEARRARVLLALGEPGIGKSRLRREILARLADDVVPPTVLLCRGDGAAAEIPYGAVGRALRSHAGLRDDQTRDERRLALSTHLGACLHPAHRADVVPFLAELAEVHLAETGTPSLRPARHDPELMRDRIRNAFVTWVRASASLRPVAIVVEDFDQVDADSLWLIESVVHELERVPIVVFLLGRPDHEPILPATLRRRATTLTLGRLDRIATARVVREVMPDADAERVLELSTRSEGNPLFLEELVRAAAEGRTEELPATVQALVQARLDTLSREVRTVLRAASVFPGTFTRAALALLVPDHDVDGALEILTSRELVAAKTTGSGTAETAYVISRSILREAAYGTLTEADRQRFHGVVAAGLRAAGGQPDPALVAHHLEAAGELADAAVQLLAAASRVFAAGSLETASRLATRALALDPESRVRAPLRLVRARARLHLGDLDGAVADGLDVAATSDAAAADRVAGYAIAGYARRSQARFAEALDFFDRAIAASADDVVSTAGIVAWIWKITALSQAGRAAEALAVMEPLLAEHRDHPDLGVRFDLAVAEGYVAWATDDVERTIGAERRALAVARESGDRLRIAKAHAYLSQVLVGAGMYELAADGACEGMILANAAGAGGLEAILRLAMAIGRMHLTSPDEILPDVETVVAYAERVGAPPLRCHAYAHAATVCLHRGAPGDAGRALAFARAASGTGVGGSGATEAALALGQALLANGEPEAAIEAVRPHLETGDPQELATRLVLVEALLVTGREREADAALAVAEARRAETIARIRDPHLRAAVSAVREHARVAALAETRLRRAAGSALA